MADQKNALKNYENNPFFIATKGLSLTFDLARGVAILLVVLSVLGLFNGGPADTSDDTSSVDAFVTTVQSWTTSEWALVLGGVFIVALALMLIGALFNGVSAYTSVQLAQDKKVRFGEAFRVAFQHLWSFLWLQIIIFVKLFLWTLLFIIPGIIMAVRYSLAGLAFYDDRKNLRGNAAIKESLRMTKGAWLTTYAGLSLFNIITLGLIASLVTTAATAVLYRQYDKLGDEKPAAHWLSWFTLALPFIIIGLLFFFIFLAVVIIGASGSWMYAS